MYILTFYDFDNGAGGTVDDNIFKSHADAVQHTEKILQDQLNNGDINNYSKITTAGVIYHYKDEKPNTIDGGLLVGYLSNYDYNNNCFITITHVDEHNGTLIN